MPGPDLIKPRITVFEREVRPLLGDQGVAVYAQTSSLGSTLCRAVRTEDGRNALAVVDLCERISYGPVDLRPPAEIAPAVARRLVQLFEDARAAQLAFGPYRSFEDLRDLLRKTPGAGGAEIRSTKTGLRLGDFEMVVVGDGFAELWTLNREIISVEADHGGR